MKEGQEGAGFGQQGGGRINLRALQGAGYVQMVKASPASMLWTCSKSHHTTAATAGGIKLNKILE